MTEGNHPNDPTLTSGGLPQARTEDEAYDIRIAADGVWHHEGRPIRRAALVKLFASVLQRDAAGDYWLITPAERGRIRVEDAPFVAVAAEWRDDTLWLRTNIDDWVAVSPDHPIRVAYGKEGAPGGTDAPRPYVMVHRGLEALIARPVFYELAEVAVERNGRLGIWSAGCFFELDSP